MSAVSLFQKELKRLTQMSYLIGSGTQWIVESEPNGISRTLHTSIASLCTDGQKVASVALAPADVSKTRKDLPAFIADLLLVYLDALLHSSLAHRAGCDTISQPPSLETLVAKLSNEQSVPRDQWWFRDMI